MLRLGLIVASVSVAVLVGYVAAIAWASYKVVTADPDAVWE